MLSGTPSTNPDLSVPFNQNEIFCCVFKSKLRETVLLYAGEIDGIRSQQQIQDTLVGKDVELIELKTVSFKAFNSYGCIKAHKTLGWWCQSYLADIQNIVCGLRNDNGIVTKIKEYKLKQLVSEGKFSWNDGVCRNFCDKFLQQVKTIVTKDCKECLYKFTYEPGSDSIIVDEIKPNPNLEYTFLYSWYIAKAKQHFEKR
ncbi:decapping and exoribonuclease protein-like [Hylaeus anthracinus]|uniref:decapping and exoribonuclease protein-like n=1 Tax=Hylaeus anthracinus TaxID=313031 RepID=UPI0023B9E337|nr:decapping and exoribonuclease protein-like [Hylaeus anthracinus]